MCKNMQYCKKILVCKWAVLIETRLLYTKQIPPTLSCGVWLFPPLNTRALFRLSIISAERIKVKWEELPLLLCAVPSVFRANVCFHWVQTAQVQAGPRPLSCFISPGYPFPRYMAAVVLTQHTSSSLGMRESYWWNIYFNNGECLKIISGAIYFAVTFNVRCDNLEQKSWE